MVNTVTLHYSEQGTGMPVVLLHGYPLNSTIWQTQVLGLSNEFRVITPDLRGHGQSPVPEGPYEMETMARDVLALLDSLNVKQAVIMGHSMGGYVTLAMWRIAKERFLGIGLIGSQPGADSEEGRQGRYAMAEKVFTGGSGVVAQAMVPKLFAPANLTEDESYVDMARNIILTTRPAGIIGTLKGMALRADSTELLPGINVPALIVSGDSDQIIPLAKAEAMADAIPGAALITIENAGHMAMLEQPQATTMALRNFLSDISYEASART